jgi:hypothetical protein
MVEALPALASPWQATGHPWGQVHPFNTRARSHVHRQIGQVLCPAIVRLRTYGVRQWGSLWVENETEQFCSIRE